jgi:hypothetical protein
MVFTVITPVYVDHPNLRVVPVFWRTICVVLAIDGRLNRPAGCAELARKPAIRFFAK